MKKKKLKHRLRPLKAFLIGKGWRLLSFLPLSWLQTLAMLVGGLIWRFAKRERRITLVNLQLAFPDMTETERQALGRQSMIESTRTLLEMGSMWMAPVSRVLQSVKSVQGLEAVEQAQQQGLPVVLLGPHIGQWEIISLWYAHHHTFSAMYAPSKLSGLDPLIRRGRERTGARLVPTDVKGVAQLFKALKRGETIGILPDQVPDSGQGGVFAPFYGHPVLTATLLPKLVQKTGARVFTALARRLPRGQGYELVLIPADERVYSADDVEAAAGVNACVEQIITYAPAQYQWAYKRFKRMPDGTNPYRRSLPSKQ